MLVVDGQGFKELVRAGLAWLQHHQESINKLNVFPVPDGDTGTNMVLTMQSAWQEIADSTEMHTGRLVQQVAHGALMGARGNSGVILSQIWRGLAHGLENEAVLDGAELAAAMEEGAKTAYRGVIRPVEGTILTVAREMAEEAKRASADSNDLVEMLERVVHRGRDAVARTPDLLPVLADAGVVDAGGQGYYIIIEGMLLHLKGETVLDEAASMPMVQALEIAHASAEGEYGYDVQFIIVGEALDVPTIRAEIDAMGECALVVGQSDTIKVHVHVPDPGVPISYGARLGSLRDVVVEDMQAQSREFAQPRESSPTLIPPVDTDGIAIVAVTAGDGLARVFRSLGVASVVEGGQTMNPSTQEIFEAVEKLPNDRVIVLPNNKNIIMAAEQARDLCEKQVLVVPTRTIPQGISAVLALNPQADLEANEQSMAEAVRSVRTGEITVATRDVSLSGVEVRKGQVIGLLDDELVVSGEQPEQVVREILKRFDLPDMEIVTLYYGADVSAAEAESLTDQLQEEYPDLEFEVLEGGQPHYFYIISAE
jgi:DAK2 domain fusion protein YloV